MNETGSRLSREGMAKMVIFLSCNFMVIKFIKGVNWAGDTHN